LTVESAVRLGRRWHPDGALLNQTGRGSTTTSPGGGRQPPKPKAGPGAQTAAAQLPIPPPLISVTGRRPRSGPVCLVGTVGAGGSGRIPMGARPRDAFKRRRLRPGRRSTPSEPGAARRHRGSPALRSRTVRRPGRGAGPTFEITRPHAPSGRVSHGMDAWHGQAAGNPARTGPGLGLVGGETHGTRGLGGRLGSDRRRRLPFAPARVHVPGRGWMASRPGAWGRTAARSAGRANRIALRVTLRGRRRHGRDSPQEKGKGTGGGPVWQCR